MPTITLTDSKGKIHVNVLISADMEGVAGVVTGNHTSNAHPEYQRFRRLMTAEVNAAIEGALGGGATKVVVNDSHGSHTNILIEELNPAAKLISGLPMPYGMMQGIGPDVDVALFVGYHGASGSEAAILEHTLVGTVIQAWLNDTEVGETGLNAAFAGAFGVPVALVTGDQTVVREARALLGAIETVVVKNAFTRTSAECLHPQVAQERIRDAAERAVRLEIAPFVVAAPVTVRVSFHRALHADVAAILPGSQRIDGRTVAWTGEDMQSAYKALMAMAGLSMSAQLL